MKVLLGKKIGMSQLFDKETGKATPVTIIDVSDNKIARYNRNGEFITHIELGKDQKKKPRAVDLGNYKVLNYLPRFRKFIKIKADEQIPEIGSELGADVFSIGDIIDVVGVTKGKGFQGVVKRWGFHGGRATHGQSDRLRAPGSIGAGTTMGRVQKGMKMGGRMGRVNRTIQNLKVIDIDVENKLISVSGSIPGNKGSYIVIKPGRYQK